MAVCDRVPAPIVTVKSLTVAKSVPEVAVLQPAPTLTSTGVSLERGAPFSAAVTVIVVAPADSRTSLMFADSSTPLEANSSSSTVTVTEGAAADP